MIAAKLAESRVRITDEDGAKEVYSDYYYGKFQCDEEEVLELSLSEAMHLVDRDVIEVEGASGETFSREELHDRFVELDDEFSHKYKVYRDLRERGYIVKSGFKFGSHFRVYEEGVNPYSEGPKRQKQHTKWVVHAVPENHTLSFQEMSRAVRLAHNIRATMLWGVVDSEGGVTYYEVERAKP
ncbi:MAG: tRNA-intron lyase [Candidatus Nanohaloarchaea archaeon]